MASDAFFPVQHRLSLRVQRNSLMPSIRAGDHTPAAANAFLPMEFGEQDRIPLQYICRFADGIKSEPLYFFDAVQSLFRQV